MSQESALDRILLDEIDRSLSDFISSRPIHENGIVAAAFNKLERGKNEDTMQLVGKIVDDIVFGPAQEVFNGQEVIDAINARKAGAFVAAFSNLAEKIISNAMIDAKEDSYATFKDFRDIFVLSVLVSIGAEAHSREKTGILSGFFGANSFRDLSARPFHDALIDFFYNKMAEEDSGAVTVAMLLQDSFALSDNNEQLKWTRPPHIDQIFTY